MDYIQQAFNLYDAIVDREVIMTTTKPQLVFTDEFNNFLKNGKQALLTKENALKLGQHDYLGDIKKDVNTIEQARKYLFKGLKKDNSNDQKLQKEVNNLLPYEGLFIVRY